MNPTQADLDEFNDFVREVHTLQSRLAAKVRESKALERLDEPSLDSFSKSVLDKFDKFIKKLDKP